MQQLIRLWNTACFRSVNTLSRLIRMYTEVAVCSVLAYHSKAPPKAHKVGDSQASFALLLLS